jgi:hypothetical protein
MLTEKNLDLSVKVVSPATVLNPLRGFLLVEWNWRILFLAGARSCKHDRVSSQQALTVVLENRIAPESPSAFNSGEDLMVDP